VHFKEAVDVAGKNGLGLHADEGWQWHFQECRQANPATEKRNLQFNFRDSQAGGGRKRPRPLFQSLPGHHYESRELRIGIAVIP